MRKRRRGKPCLRCVDCIKIDTNKAEMEDEDWRTLDRDRG